MVDLDHLETLDDDSPPTPDLGEVRSRAGRLRRRNRVAAIGTCVAVLVVAVGVVAVVRNDDPAVRVEGPTPTTPEERPTASGTLPNGLPIMLTLETPTVVLGDDIRATAVVRNDTDRTKTLGVDPIHCALGIGPALRNAAGDVAVSDFPNPTCRSVAVNLWAHTSRSFEVTLPTASVTFPPGALAGSYSLALVANGEFELFSPEYVAVPVEIVLPDGLHAHLDTPQTTYPSGYSLDGTLVFANGTGAPVDYTLECTGAPPWRVVLAKDGVHFDIAEALVGCARQHPETARLAPGETRVPFSVVLGYPGCTSLGATDPASPRCVDGGIPDLAPGTYQLVFEARGAPFSGLDVAPLTIEVTARR